MSFGDRLKSTLTKGFPGRTSRDVSPMEDGNSRLTQENLILREANLQLLETLGAVVDSLYSHTAYHSDQVAVYAWQLARKLGLSEEEQELIFKAGLVHDVGMITMGSAICDTQYYLTQGEYDKLYAHPTIGGEIIGRITHMRPVAQLVHHHHERFDGGGYPDRLKGEQIPLGARILNLADSVAMMLTDQPWRPGRSLPEVIVEVKSCSGGQFDPRVVNAFLALAHETGDDLFSSPRKFADDDMLLSTVGIRSGRATKTFKAPLR